MKKLLFSTLSLFLLVFMLPMVSSADEPIPLYLNGERLEPEVPPRLVQDTTMVPVRIIAEALGADVEWNQDEQQVTITVDQTKIWLWIGKLDAVVNASSYKLDQVPPMNDAGNTLVPVRFVAENLGLMVKWDNENRAVHMISEQPEPEQPVTEPDQPESPSEEHPAEPGMEPGAPQVPGGTPAPDPIENPGEEVQLPRIESIQLNNEQLVIQGTDELRANHFSLVNPHRIVIDLPNTVLGEQMAANMVNNTGELYVDHPMIEKIRYSLYSDKPYTVRVVIDLNSKASYKLVDQNEWNQVVMNFQPFIYNVVIDPGHGAKDPGAGSVVGKTEKEFNLSMSLKVKQLLDAEPLIQPLLTRNDDTFLELDERAAFANSQNADVFVSIHGNSFRPETRGTETFYYKADSRELADIVHKHVLEATGFPDRGVKKSRFRVITVTSMPATLLEIGFLSNEIEAPQMFEEEFQQRVAEAIVNGIKEYLGV